LSLLARIEPNRICLIKPSSLGDVVQTLPVLSALRRRFPQAHISWVVHQAYADLLEGHPDLNQVIPFDRGACSWRRPVAAVELMRFANRLRGASPDLVCDVQGLLRSGLMCALSGARWRIGLQTAREGAHWFYTHVVAVPDRDVSAVDRYWEFARAFGVGDMPKHFRVPITADDECFAERALSGATGWVYAVCPGARWPTKRWSPEHFARLMSRVARELGGTAILVGGPEDAERAADLAIRVAPAPCLNIAGRTRLRQLAAVLRRCRFVLSNDSGPMHLAAAVGTRTVALFTCTAPSRARPYGDIHQLVQTQVACAGTHRRRCERMDCMRELTPERVWPAVQWCSHASPLLHTA
jgi:heptosyltransferase-2